MENKSLNLFNSRLVLATQESATDNAYGEPTHLQRIKSKLKAPGTKRLKLEHDNLLSTFPFNIDLRRYSTGASRWVDAG
jgi:hypothetical protein